jgi:enterobactin synthetase component D
MNGASEHGTRTRESHRRVEGPGGCLVTQNTGDCKGEQIAYVSDGSTGVSLYDCPVPSHLAAPLVARGARIVAGRPPHHGYAIVTLPLPPALSQAAPRRVSTFLAGRHCAMRALRDAGYRGSAILAQGPDGSPCWPRDYVGSISHTDHRALAVVAPSALVRNVGVDCERIMRSDEAEGIAQAVVPEIRDLPPMRHSRDALSPEALVTIAFSAKESLYKCLRSLVGAYFDFSDALLVRVDPSDQRLVLRLARTLAPRFEEGMEFGATFSMWEETIVTLIVLAVDADVPASASIAEADHVT